MSQHKGVDVRIVNPVSGCGYTSRKCAQRYVDRDVAQWVKDGNGRDCLEFVERTAAAAIVATSVRAHHTHSGVKHPPTISVSTWVDCWRTAMAIILQPYSPYEELRSGVVRKRTVKP